MANNSIPPIRRTKQKRSHKKVVTFNDDEYKMLTQFCQKYKVTNQTKLLRQLIVTAILEQMEQHPPRLF
ncbi:MAG: hypothetical protein ACRC9X_07135 [Bacteroidales bacterium]